MTFRPLRHFQPALKVRTVSLSVFLFVSLFVFVVLFAFVLSLLGSVPASQAKNLSVIEVANNNFEIPRTSEIQKAEIFYTDNCSGLVPFSQWSSEAKDQRAWLSLFPGYQEPTVTYLSNGIVKRRLESLMMFVSQARFKVKKSAAKIDLAGFLDIEKIDRFDNQFRHHVIGQDQLMSTVIGHSSKIDNFQWCNQDKQTPEISRPRREISLEYVNPNNRWCSDRNHSVCLESCYLFDSNWKKYVQAINLIMNSEEKKDYGVAMQSEIRYFTSESELGISVPLSQLTHINTPVHGGLIQSLFYFNQIFEYGKVLVILQEDPAAPQNTVVTSFLVMGIKARTFKMYGLVGNLLCGRFPVLNTSNGLTAGLPVFTQTLIKSIAEVLNEGADQTR